MIEVRNLVKRYGPKTAVNDISFTVKEGEVLGFLGPNGAGKTTTMNIITGYLSATEGSVTIDGVDILDSPAEAKKMMGFLPEQPPLYMDMTPMEYLSFVYDLRGVKMKKTAHLNEICELVRITDVARRLMRNLSKGYKQRVGLAQSLVGNPKVLILDEPTVGLDPNQIIEIRRLITELGKSHTVILSSHILPEIQAVCEKVIVINKGAIVANDTPDNLSRTITGARRLLLRVAGSVNDVGRSLREMPGMKQVQTMGYKEEGVCEFIIESESAVDIRKPMFHMLSERHWPIMELRSMDLSLEDIFIELTKEGAQPVSELMREHDTVAGEDEASEAPGEGELEADTQAEADHDREEDKA